MDVLIERHGKYMTKQIEILAPAGSYEAMKAAMNAGCDAVYIGGSSFGARAYANNLEEETLLRAIDEAHIRGKQLYLTVNTLVKEKELTQELYRFLEKFYLQGLDAVIVQDVGAMHFIHEHFPKLPIHASTQTTLTMAEGANLLKEFGVTRLVTARELSLKEIKSIRENTDLEIETFVHGALCYCYSGQCLMSSMIGGRSGNRGRCAQPCRKPYQFYSEDKMISSDQEKYLISPKDINTITLIPDLVEAGIDSFKIEGRMKRPEYAAAVSAIYRKYVDLYLSIGKDKYHEHIRSKEFEQDWKDLMDIYNRGGFSEGYGKTYNSKTMMSLYRPNHSGVLIGVVKEVKGSQVAILLQEKVGAQDILEIRGNDEEDYEFTVKDPHESGMVLRTNVGRRPEAFDRNGTKAEKGLQGKGKQTTRAQEAKTQEAKTKAARLAKAGMPIIRVGDQVFRTKNNLLLEHLAAEYLGKDLRRGINGHLIARVGEKLSLTLTKDNIVVTAYHESVQEAVKQPMTKEKLTSSIEKTGDTLFYFEELTIDSDENIFVPVAWLNEIRRDAIRKFEEATLQKYRRGSDICFMTSENKNQVLADKEPDRSTDSQWSTNKTFGITVSVQTEKQLEMALRFSEVNAIYIDYDSIDFSYITNLVKKTDQAKKALYLSLPHICRRSEYNRIKKDIVSLIDHNEIKGFLVKNFEEIALLQSLWKDGSSKKEIILNYNMYVFNREAKKFWREMDINHFTAPVELNYQELRGLGVKDCDFIVYGYLPLMVSAQCLYESTEGCRKCKGGKQNSNGYLMDRLGKKFFVHTNCNGCYNIIYNGQALSLLKQEEEVHRLSPKNIRLDFTMEPADEMQQILDSFIKRYRYGKKVDQELADYTTGHFKRGVD
jgi:U32 family peptidase